MVLGSKHHTSFKEALIYHSLKMLSSCILIAIVNPEGHSKLMEATLVYIQCDPNNILQDNADLDIKQIVVGFCSLQGWKMANTRQPQYFSCPISLIWADELGAINQMFARIAASCPGVLSQPQEPESSLLISQP